jgi:hypothetical protein
MVIASQARQLLFCQKKILKEPLASRIVTLEIEGKRVRMKLHDVRSAETDYVQHQSSLAVYIC